MLASSRKDFAQGSLRGRKHEPEEEMFRDAVRIGQILSTGTNPETIDEVLSHFDQSSILRLCDTKLKALTGGPLAVLVEDVRAAFNKREPREIRAIAHRLSEATPSNDPIADLRAALMVASYHAEAALGRRPHLSETA